MSGKVKVWGNVVTVEWADPIEDPDPEVMAKVTCNNQMTLVFFFIGKCYLLISLSYVLVIFRVPLLCTWTK